MIRKIIHIDEEKCNGCGLCAEACHEGAIDIVDGKAKLMRENFCDGFGDCLPNCPTGAISFEEREAPAYDEAAVKKAQEARKMDEMKSEHHAGGCPGSRMMQFEQSEVGNAPAYIGKPVSRLAQWPCQIKLVPTQAPFFDGAKLLIAADCTAYAYANMHEEFMRGKVTIIGCPKTGCGGLHRQTYGDHPKQRYQERDHRPHGGPLLRWSSEGGRECSAEQRQIHPVAGRDDLPRRQHLGLRKVNQNDISPAAGTHIPNFFIGTFDFLKALLYNGLKGGRTI